MCHRIMFSISGPPERLLNVRKIDKIGVKPKRLPPQYKLDILKSQSPEDAIDVAFDKCKLSLKQNSIETSDNQNRRDKNGKKYDCYLDFLLLCVYDRTLLCIFWNLNMFSTRCTKYSSKSVKPLQYAKI